LRTCFTKAAISAIPPTIVRASLASSGERVEQLGVRAQLSVDVSQVHDGEGLRLGRRRSAGGERPGGGDRRARGEESATGETIGHGHGVRRVAHRAH